MTGLDGLCPRPVLTGHLITEKVILLTENLNEAKAIMETANQKHEEIKRRLKVVEEELERAVDKADDCERYPFTKANLGISFIFQSKSRNGNES